MTEEELININGIREDLYQAMQIGDITLNSKHSQELYDFMNYQNKEIERLNNIINEFDKLFENEINESKLEDDYERVDSLEYCLATLKELKGSE